MEIRNVLHNLVNSYLETAAWVAEDQEHDFSTDAKNKAIEHCKEFANKVMAEFSLTEAENILTLQGDDLGSLAGHDLWLTRNHHGAGFWDKDQYDELAENGGERLTKIAHEMGEIGIYVNDENEFELS